MNAEEDVNHKCRQEVLLQIESSESPVLTAANRAATPLSHPVELSDGTAFIDIIGTHERIKQFGSQLTEADLTFDISFLQGTRESNHVLTQRQQEFVHTAVELGYYKTPRQCTLTELASEMDVAKSTCSSTLHRAEEAIVEYFLSEQSTASHSKGVLDWMLQSPN